ncbi:Type II secretion system protein F [Pseudoalteromonas sp. CIP111854]|uniref:Type II secretion system protein F n=1 Tax=Pseudoalteromonas holothuriae TaxID=2963714 RepID=A0A9W4VUX0_9GAMM|nr:type II secretion system F family protein [Pseudoalteromonas sp. CIP111854]CAH9056822.1 Type II secretion system protein F [Pseudoalteromonas sp. CIP111854]
MDLFDYKAFDSSGAKSDGQIEAKDKQHALTQLKQQGLLITEIKAFQSQKSILQFSSKVSLADLEFLTAELSLLLQSGVRIDKGIDIIRRTKAKPALANMLRDLNSELKKGNSLSSAFRAQPDIFDPLYCNLIELGEESGNLSEIFSDLAKDLKFKRDLRSKIIGSLTYPLVILAVCLLSVFFIFNVIIPKMSIMFSDAQELPWYTELMLGASNWMTANQSYLIFAIFLGSIGLLYGSKQAGFIQWWQRVSLKLPIIQNAVTTIERIRFNSGLSMMIKSGVPIDKALALSSGNVKNHLLRRELEIARTKVKQGSALALALRQTSLYPDFFVSLLEVGEESGNLERVFEEIANRSRQDFESWTTRMTTLIEPLMILFMGGFVGSVVVIMLLSMVSLNDIGF